MDAQPGRFTTALTTFWLRDGQSLRFQDGVVSTHGENGTTNEEVIQVLVDRIRSLNELGPCRENSLAITHLEEALHWLEARTAERVRRGVEGTTVP